MGQLHQNPKSARNPSDENLKHKSMKVPNASFFEELHNNEDQEEDKKNQVAKSTDRARFAF